MNTAGYYQRLSAYVIAAMLTQFIGEGDALRDADFVGRMIIGAKILLAGVIVWRAFIDTSKVDLIDGAKDIAKRVLPLVAIGALAFALVGCATDASRPPINVQIPIGKDGRYGRIILATGWLPPVDLWDWQAAPRALAIYDGKAVVR